MKYYILKVSTQDTSHTFKRLRITFNVKKSIFGGLNSAEIAIYNIDSKIINLFSKDSTDSRKMKISLSASNQNKISAIFNGQVFKGITSRSGEDLVTTFNAFDGLDAVNTEYIGNSATKYTAFLKLCKAAGLVAGVNSFNNSAQSVAHHGKVMTQLLTLDKTRIFFIENQTAHYLSRKTGFAVGFSPLVRKSQMIDYPNKSDGFVSFSTLQNDYIHSGGMVLLEGAIGGALRVESIEITGDSFGKFFQQKVKCRYLLK